MKREIRIVIEPSKKFEATKESLNRLRNRIGKNLGELWNGRISIKINIAKSKPAAKGKP
jgi:hypothetical protein